MQVLKLDRNCEDAMTELLRVRTFQLTVSPICINRVICVSKMPLHKK